MKKWKTVVMAGVVACTLALPALAQADEMMSVKNYDYTGVVTMMKDGMELVPLRQVAERLGYQVSWMGETRSIALSKKMMDDKGMMQDKSMIDDKGMMPDKPMMDDKGMMQDKSMVNDKGMMQDKSMMDGKGIMLQIDSKTVQIGGMSEMAMYAPMLIDNMTYVTKSFVEMYLLE